MIQTPQEIADQWFEEFVKNPPTIAEFRDWLRERLSMIDDTRNKTLQRALQAILQSSLIDFNHSLDWGQWCKNVAEAALEDDVEYLDYLLNK